MFQHASPDLHRAARFALYSERVMPILQRMVDIQNGPIDPLNAMRKIHAGQAIALLRPLVFPEDDDG